MSGLVIGGTLAWLRSAAANLGVAADRINAGTVPGDAPQLVVSRVGGGVSDGVAFGLVQIDVHAATRSVAEAISDGVEAMLDRQGSDGATPSAVTVDGVALVVLAAGAESALWAPDPESDFPRFVVTGRVAVRRTGG